jgi:arginyl-tRNA synthetase
VTFTLADDAARHLALGLLDFPEAVDGAVVSCHPHKLCAYRVDLAQRFTAFYKACPVISAPDLTKSERIALCELSARTIALGLALLGIEAPAQM